MDAIRGYAQYPRETMTQPPSSNNDLNHTRVRQTIYTGIRKASLWMLGVIVFLGLLSYHLQQENWSIPFESMDWPLLLTGWGFMVGTMWVLGLRWRALLADTTASRTFFGASLSAGLLINYALPGPMGEVMCGWLLKREDNTPIVTGLTASTLARLIGLFTAAIGSILLWWWVDVDLPMAKVALQTLIVGIGCGGILIVILCLQADAIAKRVGDKDIYHPLKLISGAILQIRRLSVVQLLQAFTFSVIGHGTAFIGVWFSLMAIGGTPASTDIAFVYLVGTCCGTVAFLFPGSQFTWDAIFIGLLVSAAGYDPGSATIATGVLRIAQIAMMLFGAGPLFWIVLRQEKKG